MTLSDFKSISLVLIAVSLNVGLSSCQPTARTLVVKEIEAAEAATKDERAEGMEIGFAIQRLNRAPTGEYDADLATVASLLDVAPNDISFGVLYRYEFKTSPVVFMSSNTEVTIYEESKAIGSFFLSAD